MLSNNCMDFNKYIFKKVLILCFCLLTGRWSQAQTFDEWFRQQKTQKKYLVQQIAALKVYLGYVQEGYAIAHEGLRAIINSKKGDLELHGNFFHSLKNVNIKVSGYAKVADIITFQLQIMLVCQAVEELIGTIGLFTTAERKSIFQGVNAALDVCSTTITELSAVLTPGRMALKDNERLARIETLYVSMQEAYARVQHFAGNIKIFALQRVKEKNDVQTSSSQHGVKSE